MSELTHDQCREYAEQGYLFMPTALPDAGVDRLIAAVENLADAVGPLLTDNPRIQIEQVREGTRLRLVEPVIDLSPPIRDLTECDEILDPLRSLLGEEPALFEDKVNYKNPGGGTPFPMHQDYAYWTDYPDSLVSVMIYLDEATSENGCLQVVPGKHRQGLLPNSPQTVGLSTDLIIDSDVVSDSELVEAPGAAGSMLLFSCLTPHWSDTNNSDNPRRVIILTYNPASAGNFYDEHEGSLIEKQRQWLADNAES